MAFVALASLLVNVPLFSKGGIFTETPFGTRSWIRNPFSAGTKSIAVRWINNPDCCTIALSDIEHGYSWTDIGNYTIWCNTHNDLKRMHSSITWVSNINLLAHLSWCDDFNVRTVCYYPAWPNLIKWWGRQFVFIPRRDWCHEVSKLNG